jgi:lysophospholipase L1-like esterase
MIVKKFLLATVFALLTFVCAFAQSPYQKEIDAFKQKDKLNFPAKNQVLFVGSSSFNYWQDVQSYFPSYPIINRGFGGSSLPDVIRYANDIIFPYQAKQIVIYCGENDIAGSDTIQASTVLLRFENLFSLIRSHMPAVPIAFVSIKPSPSRSRFILKVQEANRLIKNYLRQQKRTAFVDVYNLMLNTDGSVKGEIFKSDSLHMNAKGYAIWQKAIAPVLVK